MKYDKIINNVSYFSKSHYIHTSSHPAELQPNEFGIWRDMLKDFAPYHQHDSDTT